MPSDNQSLLLRKNHTNMSQQEQDYQFQNDEENKAKADEVANDAD